MKHDVFYFHCTVLCQHHIKYLFTVAPIVVTTDAVVLCANVADADDAVGVDDVTQSVPVIFPGGRVGVDQSHVEKSLSV